MPSKEYEQLRAALKPGLAVAEDETMLVREKMTAVHPTQVPADASVERVELGGVPCAWVSTPEVEGEDRVVLLVHGGAFVSTKLEHYIPYCAGLARHLPARFLVHEYSLAPEACFPAQIEETMAETMARTRPKRVSRLMEKPDGRLRCAARAGHRCLAGRLRRGFVRGGHRGRDALPAARCEATASRGLRGPHPLVRSRADG